MRQSAQEGNAATTSRAGPTAKNGSAKSPLAATLYWWHRACPAGAWRQARLNLARGATLLTNSCTAQPYIQPFRCPDQAVFELKLSGRDGANSELESCRSLSLLSVLRLLNRHINSSNCGDFRAGDELSKRPRVCRLILFDCHINNEARQKSRIADLRGRRFQHHGTVLHFACNPGNRRKDVPSGMYGLRRDGGSAALSAAPVGRGLRPHTTPGRRTARDE